MALFPTTQAAWCRLLWDRADGIAYAGGALSFFVRGEMRRDINYVCFLAAMGAECVEAIGRIGTARVAGVGGPKASGQCAHSPGPGDRSRGVSQMELWHDTRR